MNGRGMSRNTSAKRTFTETQRNQMVESADRRSPLRRQKAVLGKMARTPEKPRLKNDFTCMSKFEKKFLKLAVVDHEYAECGHFV